ncbi:hypothetical protein AMAG_15097 [Allomyces macrogynus ATCC 38327]|uniref:Uncharacterized protein n=1 Tax=Allomyces macrogynus (strain ATCC 38327) TaxID=578462 RepID=A0A0L0T5U7_ALLM3|nr:hypothetical protein AMAG_15097 [Allomyces macrogynus ATCC 38327]|eukprot:KNE70122.1 hypothetical protein AMAG_15097 [Allomyces macrogynus ATCC 38327]
MCPAPLLPCPVATAAASSAMLPPLPPHSLLLPVAVPFPVVAGTPPMHPLPSSVVDDDMPAFIPIPLTIMEAMMHESRSTAAASVATLAPLPGSDAERLCRAPLITNRPRAVQREPDTALLPPPPPPTSFPTLVAVPPKSRKRALSSSRSSSSASGSSLATLAERATANSASAAAAAAIHVAAIPPRPRRLRTLGARRVSASSCAASIARTA